MVSLIFIGKGIFFFYCPQNYLSNQNLISTPLSLQVVMTMSSVSAVMEACDAGSLEMILGWSMLSGFLGK